MPPAARISDMHTCPMVNPGPVPHVGGPDISGSPNVITGYLPQARVSDSLVCVPAIDKIAQGSPTVIVNNLQAARLGDPTVHGGRIVAGCPTVIIGNTGQGATLAAAAADGTPFCEECEKLKKKLEEEAKKEPPPNAPPPGSANTLTKQGKEILEKIKEKIDEIIPPEKREEFQHLIKVIKPVAKQLLAKGEDEQSVAKWALAAREAIGAHYGKEFDSYGDLAVFIYDRNKLKFGDALGPQVEWLMSEKGKTAREVIEAAASGNLKEKLGELKPQIIDKLASQVTDDARVKALIQSAANGKLKEGIMDFRGEIGKEIAGRFTDSEAVKNFASSAAQGKLDEGLQTFKGEFAKELAAKVTDNENLQELAGAAAQGQLSEKFAELKGDLAADAIQKITGNETIANLSKAAVDNALPEALGELSSQTVEKFMGNIAGNNPAAAKVLNPITEWLKGQVTQVVTEKVGGLLGGV